MAFVNKNNFIAEANNPPWHMVMLVYCTIWFKINKEMINNGNNTNQNNVDIVGTLESENEDYRTSDVRDSEREDFMSLNSPWFLLHLIVTDAEENEEPHILSWHHMSQTCHYYLIDSACGKAIIFCSPFMEDIANIFLNRVE